MKSKRNHSIHSKKVVSAVLASLVALSPGTAVFADATTNVTANNAMSYAGLFSDVKSGYWADKHINKLASLKIILGDKGLFRPNDSVTQQEAITMAIRFMNIEDQLNNDASIVFPSNFTVNNYYKPYLALAFQHKLLDKKVEADDATTKAAWGSKKASREWITELLIRAIGKESEAIALSSKATSFVDNSRISKSKLGFVNAAIQLGITNGVEGNRFDPLGSVTRAQLATFFSRGQDHTDTKYANATEGIVTAISNNSISLSVNGSIRNFPITPTTSYYTKTSEAKMSLSDIKLYSKVMIVDNNGSSSYVEIIDPKEQLETIETTFERLFPGNSLGTSSNTGFESYQYQANTTFLDVNGKKIEAKDITPGSQIIIKRENFSSSKNIIIVQVKTGIVNKKDSGTLENMDVNNKTVIIKNSVGTMETYKWESVPSINYQGQFLTPMELMKGSQINYEIKNNNLVSIVVTQAVERKVTGTLYEVGSNGTITFTKPDGNLDVKLLSSKVEILINGLDKPVLSDLIAGPKDGDKIELTLDAKEVITKIAVLSRNVEQKQGVTVVDYRNKDKERWLTIEDANHKRFVYSLDDKTKVSYNTISPTLAGIEPLLSEGRKVNISYINGRVLSIEIVYKYDGIVTAVDTMARKITIQGIDGQSKTFAYQIPFIEMNGKGNLTMSDVKIGSEVSILLADNQEVVSKILLPSTAQYEVATVDSGNKWVTTKFGIALSHIYLDQATVKNESGQIIKGSDIQPGQVVNVVYRGNTPISVQLTKMTIGQVLTVDASTSSVGVKTYNGTTEVVKVDGALKIVRGSNISTNLNGLIATDRVEIRKDVDGTSIIKVLTSSKHEFWKHTSGSQEIYVKRQYVSDNNRFILSPNAYIHQSDTTIPVQSLKESDIIVLYFNNDIVVEIQKQ
ncbi:S-layer homology domain-containing protein [Paenibacillus sp. CMAA1364]